MGLEIDFAMLLVYLCQNLLSQKIAIFFPMKAMSGLPVTKSTGPKLCPKFHFNFGILRMDTGHIITNLFCCFGKESLVLRLSRIIDQRQNVSNEQECIDDILCCFRLRDNMMTTFARGMVY